LSKIKQITLKYTFVKYAFRVAIFSFDWLTRSFISFNCARRERSRSAQMPAEDLDDPKEGSA